MTGEHVVLDASALVDLVVTARLGPAVEARIHGAVLHAPAHLDAEVLSALGRLHGEGDLPAAAVARHLDTLAVAPIERHRLADLLRGRGSAGTRSASPTPSTSSWPPCSPSPS